MMEEMALPPEMMGGSEMMEEPQAMGGQEGLDYDDILGEFMQEGGTPEDLDAVISLLQAALQQPDAYPEIYQHLQAMDIIDEGDIPYEFDERFIGALLQIFMHLQEVVSQKMQQQPQGFARGGLASLGRGPDTMLAHVSPTEAAMLRSFGGSGAINPRTGLPEYNWISKAWKKLKKVVKKVVSSPLFSVAMAFVPGLNMVGPWLGQALGASGAMAAGLGNAIISGGASKLAGNSWGKALGTAALGGLTGYAGAGGFGGGATQGSLMNGLGDTTADISAGMANSVGSGMGTAFGGATQPTTVSGLDAITGAGSSPNISMPASPGFAEVATSVPKINANMVQGPTGFSGLAGAVGEKAMSTVLKNPMTTLDFLNKGSELSKNVAGYQTSQLEQELMQKAYDQAMAQGASEEEAQAEAQQAWQSQYQGGTFGANGMMGNAGSFYNPGYMYAEQGR